MVKFFTKKIFVLLKKLNRVNKSMIYFAHYQNIFHFIFMNMFIANGVFLSTRTLLHVKNWAPSYFLNFDRIFCLFIFFCYWVDLLELFMTSMNSRFRSEYLGEKEKARIETAKRLLKTRENSVFDDSIKKQVYESLPSQVPLQALTRDEANGLGYRET